MIKLYDRNRGWQTELPPVLSYRGCRLCPRKCGVDRTAGERGFCGSSHQILAARASLHQWEEPCLSGERGSGTVFFSGCSLKCVYCQNLAISRGQTGKTISEKRLSEIFLELQEKGAHNINLVTAAHFLPSVYEALILSREEGLSIPVLYNSSGYEDPAVLAAMEGLIDIYLPDFKYMSRDLALRYSACPDYPERAKEALAEMVRQAGEPVFDAEGHILKGVIVRHLLLPGCGRDSKAIVRYLHETYGDRIYISLMRQYTPMEGIGKKYPELDRRIDEKEYDRVVSFALRLGVENGFIQESGTAEESFIPPFNNEGI